MSLGTGIPTRIIPPYTGDDLTGIPTRIVPDYIPDPSAGTTNHQALSNLAWEDSLHTGTALFLAGFSGAGAATYVDPASLGISDHTALSNLAWTSSAHTGTTGSLAYFSAGTAAETSNLTWDETTLTLGSGSDLQFNNQGSARFYDSTNTNYIEFSAAPTMGSNIILTWPDQPGLKHQLLHTDGSDALSFNWADRVIVDARNASGVTINAGDPVYVTGYNSGVERVEIGKADASDPAKMSAIGVAATQINNNSNGEVVLNGFLEGVDTSLLAVNTKLYVAPGGGFTSTKPTGTNLIQNIAIVFESDANGTIAVLSPGRTNDVPNLPQDYLWIGNASGVATPTALSTISTSIDHSSLSNLAWGSSGHTGTVSSIAAFDGSGNPTFKSIGTDIQAWSADLDTYAANPLTSAELNQLQTIDTVTISNAQWGYLGALASAPVEDNDIGVTVQAYDADLSAIAALATTGLLVRTAADTWAHRSIASGDGISVSLGDGVAGNPSIAVTADVLRDADVGSQVQAWDADLDTIAGLASADSNFIVGSATGWVVESGATARASLGLTIGTHVQAWSADLDTYASNPLTAVELNQLQNIDTTTISTTQWGYLGALASAPVEDNDIGVTVQAYDADLTTIAGLSNADSNFIVGNGSTWVVESGATARTSLGLGSTDSVTFDSVTITNGIIFDGGSENPTRLARTYNLGAASGGLWWSIATITIGTVSLFGDFIGDIFINNGVSGAIFGGRIVFRVKQQAALGNLPGTQLTLETYGGTASAEIRAIITQNDATATVVTLYAYSPNNFSRVTLDGVYSGNATFAFVTPSSGLAAGTTISPTGDFKFWGDVTIEPDSVEAFTATQTKVQSIHLEPLLDSTYNLGTTSIRWSTIYGDAIDASSSVTAADAIYARSVGTTGLALRIGNDMDIYDISTADGVGFRGIADATRAQVRFGSAGTYLMGNEIGLHIGGTSGVEATTARLEVDGDILANNVLPQANDTYDLGSASLSWANLYLASTIHHKSDLSILYNQSTESSVFRTNGEFETRHGLMSPFGGFGKVLNGFSYSEDLSNAAWTKGPAANDTVTVVTNDTTAPDGTTTADKLTLSNGTDTGTRIIVRKSITTAPNTPYVVSFWAKKVSGDFDGFSMDLGDIYPAVPATTTITTEWKRYVFYLTSTATDPNDWIDINIRNHTAGVDDVLHMWGLQLSLDEAGPYTKTEANPFNSSGAVPGAVINNALAIASYGDGSDESEIVATRSLVLRAQGDGDILFFNDSTEMGRITTTGLEVDGIIALAETGTPPTHTAGEGYFWVQNNAPNTPAYTDDTGNDYQLGYYFGAWAGEDSTGLVGYTSTTNIDFGSGRVEDIGPNGLSWDSVNNWLDLTNAGVYELSISALFAKAAGSNTIITIIVDWWDGGAWNIIYNQGITVLAASSSAWSYTTLADITAASGRIRVRTSATNAANMSVADMRVKRIE